MTIQTNGDDCRESGAGKPGDPKVGDTLDVLQEIYDGSRFESYLCEWKDKSIEVYPYECEELPK